MRRTSDIKNFKTQKNFTLTFKSILLYIHKRGCKIKMTEKESRSKVTKVPQFFNRARCPMSSYELLLYYPEMSTILVSTLFSCSPGLVKCVVLQAKEAASLAALQG